MVCSISCSISAIFLIGMIFFYNRTGQSKIVKHYKGKLPTNLQKLYEKITDERKLISYHGYILGVALSLLFLFYNIKIKHTPLKNMHVICIVMSISFITNYFYYILSPKSAWMLNHVNDKEQVVAWLQMYREMSLNYHLGLALGIIAVGIFSFAFRCV